MVNQDLSVLSQKYGYFDREYEIQLANSWLLDLAKPTHPIVWIEGPSGVGKSEFAQLLIDGSNVGAFRYLDGTTLFKCRVRHRSEEFSYIAELFTQFETKDASLVSSEFEAYFEKISSIPLLSAITAVIPSINGLKWTKSLIDRSEFRIDSARINMHERFLKRHLVNCFSEIAINILLLYAGRKPYIIGIDDITSIDHLSLSTLISIINKSRHSDLNLIFIFTTRDKLSIDCINAYEETRDQIMKDRNKVKEFTFENFDRSTSSQFLISSRPELNKNQIKTIIDLTLGNPLELSQAVKLPPNTLDQKLRIPAPPEEHQFSYARLEPIFRKNSWELAIMETLAFFDDSLTLEVLELCARRIFDGHSINVDSGFRAGIDYLEAENFLTRKNNLLSLSHDSALRIVREYSIEAGRSARSAEILTSALMGAQLLIKFFPWPLNVVKSLKIFSEFDPANGVTVLQTFVCDERNSRTLTASVARMGCEIASASLSNTGLAENEDYLVILAEAIARHSVFEADRVFLRPLMAVRESLSANGQFRILSAHARLLAEKSDARDLNMERAQAISSELVDVATGLGPLQEVKALLIDSSVNERPFNSERIEYADKQIEVLLNTCGQKSETLALEAAWLRNKGLLYFHGDLIIEYENSVNIAKRLSEKNISRSILVGTCLNNLGLANLYRGKIKTAESNFLDALSYFNEISFEAHRTYNNLGIIKFFSGEINRARELFLAAANADNSGEFESLSVQVNFSLVLWADGEQDAARASVYEIIEEYKSGTLRSADHAVYARALMQAGYFELLSGSFSRAADFYKESMIHDFRFLAYEEKKRRQQLSEYCLFRAGRKKSRSEFDVDMVGKTSLIYDKPYNFQPLAYYIA